MNHLFRQVFTMLTGSDDPASFLKVPKTSPEKAVTERQLIQLESEIGKELFGPIPAGHRREFFSLDADTWIWHEEYKDEKSVQHSVTTRYEVQKNGVLKVQDGSRYSFLEGSELQNFGLAVQSYYERVMREIYRRDPKTGYKLS
ncbi:hypothetical protein KBD87_01175 [Candidatus Saccharibacteria bacterium]|nr:hypothetical protein [Candidatus Saccharibacteria bacterium]